jgi:hypothetical protein
MSTYLSIDILGGPQDGSKISMQVGYVASRIWVGPKWLGDGFSAFTKDGPSKRFPIELVYEDGKYKFVRDTRSIAR